MTRVGTDDALAVVDEVIGGGRRGKDIARGAYKERETKRGKDEACLACLSFLPHLYRGLSRGGNRYVEGKK